MEELTSSEYERLPLDGLLSQKMPLAVCIYDGAYENVYTSMASGTCDATNKLRSPGTKRMLNTLSLNWRFSTVESNYFNSYFFVPILTLIYFKCKDDSNFCECELLILFWIQFYIFFNLINIPICQVKIELLRIRVIDFDKGIVMISLNALVLKIYCLHEGTTYDDLVIWNMSIMRNI